METQQLAAPAHQLIPSADVSPQRRSANYKPSLWKYDFLESLTSKYDREEYTRESERLISYVKDMFVETEDLQAKLELIDSIKKLGFAYHFEEEIANDIETIADSCNNKGRKCPFVEDSLYLSSLCFKLLRQQGYHVSQDMFRGFTEDTEFGSVKSVVELLEASHLALEGETKMDLAKELATNILRNTSNFEDLKVDKNSIKTQHDVDHALELPSHWRVSWFDVKWQVKSYEKNLNCGGPTILLDLAKLSFNITQSTLQKELRELSSWWRNLGLTESLNFARDRLVESFMCSVGLAFQPQYKCLRKCLTKVVTFILIIDDLYDLFGTLEELKSFTTAVERWDFKEIDQLPDCMKICFQALYDTTCEIAYDIETEIGGKSILPYLQKAWVDFCKSLLVEAEWDHKAQIPTFQEYLSNAWISSSGPLLLTHIFFCTTHHDLDEEVSEYLEKHYDLVYNISLIIRLCNDLGTSTAEQERGDAPSSILCFMKEMDTTEDAARRRIGGMITKSWGNVNSQFFAADSVARLSPFVEIALNAARVAHCLYQSGDAFGVQVTDNKKLILSLLVEPLR